MRSPAVYGLACAALAAGASLALAFSSGPPASRTGAPAVGGVAAEANCTACHTGFALNTAGATLEILDVPASYITDSLYTLRVRMTSTFAPPRRWGFQITAVRDADGQGAGTFDVTGLTTVQIVAGTTVYASRRYVEHTSAGTFPLNNGPVEWTFRWRAPATNLGRIRFFAAGNAANNSSTNAGDRIYTTSAQSDPHPLLDARPLAADDALEGAAPNPFRAGTTIRYALARAGAVDLAVFDAQGRRVRTLASGPRPAGPASAAWDGTSDAGAPAEPGVYFVRLVTPDRPAGLARRVVRVR